MKFSDRLGLTNPPTIFQIDEISESLKNSLWNLLVLTYYKEWNEEISEKATRLYCMDFFKEQLDELPHEWSANREWLKSRFYSLKWYDVYNFMEFVYQNVGKIKQFAYGIYFSTKLNSILEEEFSGYRITNSLFVPISNQSEIDSIHDSLKTSGEKGLFGVQKHFETSIQLLSKRPDPDYRNSIKESISAIESLAKQITGEEGGGLDKALAKLDAKINIHGSLKKSLRALYGYTSEESGIRHAILEEANIDIDDAKFMLVSCSGFANYLISKSIKVGILK